MSESIGFELSRGGTMKKVLLRVPKNFSFHLLSNIHAGVEIINYDMLILDLPRVTINFIYSL